MYFDKVTMICKWLFNQYYIEFTNQKTLIFVAFLFCSQFTNEMKNTFKYQNTKNTHIYDSSLWERDLISSSPVSSFLNLEKLHGLKYGLKYERALAL
jgi:hypothetical protein